MTSENPFNFEASRNLANLTEGGATPDNITEFVDATIYRSPDDHQVRGLIYGYS